MRYILFLFFLLSLFECFSQWEITNWKNDSEILFIYASGKSALTHGDRLITTNKGVDWKKCNDSVIKNNYINCILQKDSLIFIGTYNNLLVSSDNGNTWYKKENGLEKTLDIIALITLDEKVFVFTSRGIYYSIDNGSNWILKNNDFKLKNYNAVTVVGSNIFAKAGSYNEIYLSTDQGESWSLKNNGLYKYDQSNQFAVIGDKIFTISYNFDDIFLQYPRTVYMSSDMGNSWVKKDSTSLRFTEFSFVAIDGRLFVGSSYGMYYSDDFGDTWTKKSLTNDYYSSAEYLAVGDGIIYGASGTEIFKSTDRGNTWTAIRNSKNYGLVISLETRGNRIYSCTSSLGNDYSFHDGLYYSTDKGDTWVKNYLDSFTVNSVFFKDNLMFAGTNRGLYRSDISTINWKKLNENFGYDQLTAIDNLLYATGYGGYYVSFDDGDTWIEKKYKFPSDQHVQKILIGYNHIIACLDSTVMIKYNNSNLLEEINNGLPYDNLRIKAIEKIDDVIFLGTGFGVYTSSDMGESWQLRNNGIPLKNEKYIEVKDFAKVGKNIFVGIRSLGVFVSKDMGLNWKSTNNSIFKNLEISSLTILDDYIYAGTDRGSLGDDGDAIYRAKLSDFGITDVEDNTNIKTSILYPNPAKTNVSLDFIVEPENLPNITVELYNLTGVLQSNLNYSVDYNNSNGQGTLNCNIENIPNGYYIIVIDNGKRKIAKPVIVNKD